MTTNQPHINAEKLNSQQQSELWSLLMSSTGESTLRMIHKYVTDVSPLQLHPFHMLPTSPDDNFRRSPAGHKDHHTSHFGQRFHIYFYLLRASSIQYFGFPTIGKKPHIRLVRRFLYKYGIKQGGELARSTDFCELIADSHCTLETTGYNTVSENR